MRLFRLLHAIVFLLSLVVPAFANTITDDPFLAAAVKKMGPNSSIEVIDTNRDGVVTRTYQVRICGADGVTCKSFSGTVYRDTQVRTTIEGKTLQVQAIDRADTTHKRLNFKITAEKTPEPKSSTSSADSPLPAPIEIDLNPSNPLFDDIAKVAPSIAMGVIGGLQDMKAAEQAAYRLQEAYEQVQAQTRAANAHQLEIAKNQSTSAAANSGYLAVAAAEILGRPVQSTNRGQEYQAYLKAARDPFSFKDYEMTPVARARLLAKARAAMANKEVRPLIETANLLFHQTDPALRAEARQALAPAFKDGVLRAGAFMNRAPSLLDQAGFHTALHSSGGFIVREVANKAQSTWIETAGLESLADGQVAAYVSALASLRSADDSFAAGKFEDGLYLAEVADKLLDFSRGFYQGGLRGLTEAAEAIPAVAKALGHFSELVMDDPRAAATQFGEFVDAIPGMAEAVGLHYLFLADQIASGAPVQQGEALGQLGSDVVLAFLTDGAASAVKAGVRASSVAVRSAKIAELTHAAAKNTFVRAAELSSKFAPASAKAMVALARSEAKTALEVMTAAGVLAKQSPTAFKDYVGFVLTNKAGMTTAVVKSTKAVTSAVSAGVIKTSEQLNTAKKFLTAIDELPHQIDFRQIGDFDKVALMGRDMRGNVHKIRDKLSEMGIKAEVFETSQEANNQWARLVAEHQGACNIPKSSLETSLGYFENKSWIQHKRDTGFTILDANNPGNLPPSTYYDMECSVLSGGPR